VRERERERPSKSLAKLKKVHKQSSSRQTFNVWLDNTLSGSIEEFEG